MEGYRHKGIADRCGVGCKSCAEGPDLRYRSQSSMPKCHAGKWLCQAQKHDMARIFLMRSGGFSELRYMRRPRSHSREELFHWRNGHVGGHLGIVLLLRVLLRLCFIRMGCWQTLNWGKRMIPVWLAYGLGFFVQDESGDCRNYVSRLRCAGRRICSERRFLPGQYPER